MKLFQLTKFVPTVVALALSSATGARAGLVTPPTFTAISVPATATLNQTVNISASAVANYSDNSDGNNWNTPDHIRILVINIEYLKPGGSWTNIANWCPTWTSPNSNSANLTLDTPGTWYVRFQAMDGRPWFEGWPTYAIAVSPPPGPVITSSLALGVNQGGYVNYVITATNIPTAFSATNLPPGLSLNTSTGHIYGNYTGSSSVNTTITASNVFGTDAKTLSWSVTAASISGSASVSPSPQADGQPVTLAFSAYANFGVAWVERTVWRPNGTAYSPGSGTGTAGSISWTPDGGAGNYWFTIRVVDNYYNYRDYAASFQVRTAPTAAVSIVPASISFGQSSAVTMTLSQTGPWSLLYHWMLWEQGNGSYWSGIGFGWNFPSSTLGMTNISNTDGLATGASSSTKSFTYTPNFTGSAHFLSWGYDGVSAPSGYPAGSVTISKATPTLSNWSNRSFPGSFTVQTSDLNAVLANPYSSAVSAPSGSRAYALNGAGASAGATVYPGTYTANFAYAGDANYHPVNAPVTWTVANRNPGISVQILNASRAAIALNGSGRAPVAVGQQFFIRVNGSDPDGGLAMLYSRLNNASGTAIDYPQVAVSGGSASYDFGPYAANQLGVWNVWAHVADAHNTGYQWQGQGWAGSDSPDVEVFNRDPSISVQILNAGRSAIALNGSGRAPVAFGQQFYIRVNGSDPDGSLTMLYSRLNNASGTAIDYPQVAVSGGSASYDFGPYTANQSGVWNVWAHVADAHNTGYQWQGQGWAGSDSPDVEVVNTAPSQVTPTGLGTTVLGATATHGFGATDADGNLQQILVHYRNVTANTPYRLLRAGDTIADYSWNSALPSSSATGALATSGGTNGLNRSRSWVPDLGPGVYDYHLRAIDAAGVASFNVANFSVSGATTPGSFQVTMAGSSSVALSWTASTTLSGVNRYEILRGGTLIASVGGAVLAYTDTTAASSTAYTYVVRAVDNSGNVSVLSNPVNATTASSFELFTPL